MNNKICVYTVCQNCSDAVDAWCSQLSEADYINVIVHDTKDETAERFFLNGINVVFTHYQNYDHLKAKTDALRIAKENFPDCKIFIYSPIECKINPNLLELIRNKWDGELLLSYCDNEPIREVYNKQAEINEHGLAWCFFKLGDYDSALMSEKIAVENDPGNNDKQQALKYYERLSTNKICVYTTCYNESKFIDHWLENNKDADHIVVLIHDCKDDSEEKFKKAGPKVSIGYGFYPEWRFDKGKNDAMHLAHALAPECNIFVFTSLDEYWDDGWALKVKENWIPGVTQQCWYNFVQGHDEFGHETTPSYFNWMISKDPKWHWEYPIHEAIIYGDKEPVNSINLFQSVKLQHWPDNNKPRNYLQLHELRYNEYKDDMSLLYLIRENIIQNRLSEAYNISEKFNDAETKLAPCEHAYIHIMRGICCEYLDKYNQSLDEYKKAWDLDNNLRTPLIRTGVVYAKCGAYKKAEEFIQKALNSTHRTYSWLEDPWDWRSKPFYWLSVINMNLGNKEKALGYALFAKQIDNTNEMKKNYLDVLEKCRL